jgi:hypothetical protein
MRSAMSLGPLLLVLGCSPIDAVKHPGATQLSDTACDAADKSCSQAEHNAKPKDFTDDAAGASAADIGFAETGSGHQSPKPDPSGGSGGQSAAGPGTSAAAAIDRDAGAAGIGGTAGVSSPSTGSSGDAGDAMTAAAQASPGDDTPTPPDPSECDYVEVRARSDAMGSPFEVPAGETDLGQCFLFDAGFESPTQALGFSPLVDKADLISYIVLRTLERSDHTGAVVTCADTYPTHKLVAAWAAGAGDWYYPKDTGIDMGRGLFLLEVHYNNANKPAATDRSGMRVCTTKKLRPRAASLSWLGNQTFTIPAGAKDYAVNGLCKPDKQTDPIHMLRIYPFMNSLGKHVSVRINHIDGSMQPVLDVPFSLADRKIYDTPATVRQGDSVATTCVYDNPRTSSVSIGVGTGDELCHIIVLATPAYQLVNDNFSTENNSCISTR